MTFDPTKPVQTRSGKPARIITTDAAGPYPIIALITDSVGDEDPETYSFGDGFASYLGSANESGWDLFNVPEETVEFRTVRFGSAAECSPLTFGCLETAALATLQSIVGGWDGIVKITTVDGKLTGLELVA